MSRLGVKTATIISKTVLPKTGTQIVKTLGDNGSIWKEVILGPGNSLTKQGFKSFESWNGILSNIYTKGGDKYMCTPSMAKKISSYSRRFFEAAKKDMLKKVGI